MQPFHPNLNAVYSVPLLFFRPGSALGLELIVLWDLGRAWLVLKTSIFLEEKPKE